MLYKCHDDQTARTYTKRKSKHTIMKNHQITKKTKIKEEKNKLQNKNNTLATVNTFVVI